MFQYYYFYKSTIFPKYIKTFYSLNKQTIPKLKSLTLNIGLGMDVEIPLKLESNKSFLNLITGQRPIYTKVKHTLNRFKIKKNNRIGLKVTLRRFNLYNFLEKLINIIFPRIRNFTGFSYKQFNNDGTYSFGFRFQDICTFSEIKFSEKMPLRLIHGFELHLNFNSKEREYNMFLLREFKFPFNKK